MLVYTYAAALYCEDCGTSIREGLNAAGKAPADADDEESYDSNDYPKGPVEEGESDSPSHCDACHKFLESSLTADGQVGLMDTIVDAIDQRRITEVLLEWVEFYEIRLDMVLRYVAEDNGGVLCHPELDPPDPSAATSTEVTS